MANQDIPITSANEVLIIDSGDAPTEILQQLCSVYSWIDVRRVATGVDYYDTKMQGVTLATRDIVVYADSDCIYEPNWLRNILLPFTQNSDIHVVAGETSLVIEGLYDLAMAIAYFLPRFFDRETLYHHTFIF